MSKGPIVAIGGNVDTFPDEPILREVYRLASLRHDPPKIVIIPSASEESERTGKKYSFVFEALGADARIVNPISRRDSNDPKFLKEIEEMDGVFLGGGVQLRFTAILGGTELLHEIRNYFNEGSVVAGTSAGAASMTKTMIAYGESYEALLKGKVELSPGLGFVDGGIFDTHFITRGRLPRLIQVIAENPSLIGVGIGEDTSIILDQEIDEFCVMGSRNVVVVDAHGMEGSNIPEINHGAPISAENITVHILKDGCGYDMKNRVVKRACGKLFCGGNCPSPQPQY